MGNEVVRTSQGSWQVALVKNYQKKEPFTFKDDAGLGIDPRGKSLFEILRAAGLTAKEGLAIVSALGVAGWGARILRVALADPEPRTKIALTIVGSAMILLPFGATWKLLTGESPGYVKVGPNTFEVKWQNK